MANDDLTVRWSGGERSFGPGAVVRIGRDLDMDIRLENSNVSRRHLEVSCSDGRWHARDVGSAQGTWQAGGQVSSVDIVGPVELSLGREGIGERITLEARATAQPDATVLPAAPAAAAPTEVVPPGAGGVGGPSGAGASDGTIVVGGQNRPGGALREGAIAGATVVTGESLTLECAGRSTVISPGATVVVGRDAACDLVTTNPTVSRQHARFSHDGTSWLLEDLGSSSGTFVDGKRVTSKTLEGRVAVWLGDEETGERVIASTSGSHRTRAERRRRLVPFLAIATVIIAGLLAAFLLIGRGPDEDELARGTVRISTADWIGSGTIIDAHNGLILTNAHVVAPSSPGAGVFRRKLSSELEDNPKRLVIEIADGKERDAEPRYLGEVVASDGYLDLAVVKITKTVGGRIIEPGDLDGLVEIAVGDSDELTTGDAVRILGYPLAANSRTVTLTEGVVSGPVKDDRLGSNRGMLNISADIRGGNSGGLAVNDDGELIGIPTLVRGEQVSSMRPASWAVPLIEAARQGKSYTSPWVRPLQDESVSDYRLVTPGTAGIEFNCKGDPVRSLDGLSAVGIAFDFDGFTAGKHQDVFLALLVDGEVVGRWTAANEYPVKWPASGCATVSIPIDVSGVDTTLKPRLVVGLGPNYVAPD